MRLRREMACPRASRETAGGKKGSRTHDRAQDRRPLARSTPSTRSVTLSAKRAREINSITTSWARAGRVRAATGRDRVAEQAPSIALEEIAEAKISADGRTGLKWHLRPEPRGSEAEGGPRDDRALRLGGRRVPRRHWCDRRHTRRASWFGSSACGAPPSGRDDPFGRAVRRPGDVRGTLGSPRLHRPVGGARRQFCTSGSPTRPTSRSSRRRRRT